MVSELLVLRLVHLLAGTFWVGTAIFTAAFLFPTLREVGPAAASVMAGLQKRRLMLLLPVTSLLALLSGARLLWIVSGGFSADFLATPRGLTFSLSGGAAVVAFLLGLLVARPAIERANAMAARLGSEAGVDREATLAEINRLRQRSARVATMVASLLVLTVAGMAVARYL